MPFVKRSAPPTPLDAQAAESAATIVANLANPDAEVRWSAARALGSRREGVDSLAAALGAERVPRVREAIMTALMRIGDAASVRSLLPCLRSQDASLRAAAIEALQSLPDAIGPFLEPLLTDSDSDVRILATELARNMPGEAATRLLCGMLEREQHANVCAAAIELLSEVGTRAAIPTLRACAERFSEIPFLTFAVSTAIAQIQHADG